MRRTLITSLTLLFATLCIYSAPATNQDKSTPINSMMQPLADVDITAFSTSVECLSYISAGSSVETGDYAKKISNGLDIVLTAVDNNNFTRSKYSGFITVFPMIFLAELLYDKDKLKDEDKRKSVKKSLEKIVRLVEEGQKEGVGVADGADGSGAWGYSIAEDKKSGRRKAQSAACCVIGLIAAKKAGIKVSEKAIDNGISYLRRCVSQTGQVGYQGPQTPQNYGGYGRTAGLLYCMKYANLEKESEYQKALKWLDANKPEKDYDAHAGAFMAWGFIWGGLFHSIRNSKEDKIHSNYLEEIFKDIKNKDGTWNGKEWKFKDTALFGDMTRLAMLGYQFKDKKITVLLLEKK
ncbi:MAG: hypothetical protein A2W23_08465 [Planctomycetes bacterium RBG_16_43_13]|nr:MAG: hypothetical protein A2W23_08465 [Planctomycetes bacterium RBG_16_43_13]